MLFRLPWICSSLLLGFHLSHLVTLDRWFATFGVSFVRFCYPRSAVCYFWGFFRSLLLLWITTFLLFGILSLALVTLDQRFPPFRVSFTRFGYPNRHFPPFRVSFTRFGYPGSAFSSFSGFIHSLWLPKSALSSFSGFFHSLWLPWISVFLLFGFLSLSLVTLDQRFPPFQDSFTRFGYPISAVNKKRIGITPIPFLSRVSVYLFI